MKSIFMLLLLILFALFGQESNKKGTIKVKKVIKEYVLPDTASGAWFGSVIWSPSSVSNDGIAEYTGGMPAIRTFIAKTLIYPENSIYKGMKGAVSLSFSVDTTGVVSDIRVDWGMKGCKACDEEAVRILSLMKGWKPGKWAGTPIQSVGYMNVPFEFLK